MHQVELVIAESHASPCHNGDCAACRAGPKGAPCLPALETAPFICRCFRISEVELITILETEQIQTLQDLSLATGGAGEGCMACRQTLERFLAAANR